MGNSNSKPKGPQITDHDRAVLNLKVQRDKLAQSKRRLAIVVDKETQIAMACLNASPPDREKAKLALRKKKRQQSLLGQLESQSDTLEQIIETIEFKLIEKDVLHGLEMGNSVLKEINKELSIEKVDRIMDESAEGVQYQMELSERLSEVLTTGEESEVESELYQMQVELGMVEDKTKNTNSAAVDKLQKLPKVSDKIDINVDQVDLELNEQQQELLPA